MLGADGAGILRVLEIDCWARMAWRILRVLEINDLDATVRGD